MINAKPFNLSDKLAKTLFKSKPVIFSAEDLNREFSRLDYYSRSISSVVGAMRNNFKVSIINSVDSLVTTTTPNLQQLNYNIQISKENNALPAYIYFNGVRFNIPFSTTSFTGTVSNIPVPGYSVVYLCLFAKSEHKTFGTSPTLCGLTSTEHPTAVESCEVDIYTDEELVVLDTPDGLHPSDPTKQNICVVASIVPEFLASYQYGSTGADRIKINLPRKVRYHAATPQELMSKFQVQTVHNLSYSAGYAATDSINFGGNGTIVEVLDTVFDYVNSNMMWALSLFSWLFVDKTTIENNITTLTNLINNANASISTALNMRQVPLGAVIAYVGNFDDFDTTGLGVRGDKIGFAVCNGENNTIDLRRCFIVGSDVGVPASNAPSHSTVAGVSYAHLSRGGENFHALTANENGSHTHGVTDPGHIHSDVGAGAFGMQGSSSPSSYAHVVSGAGAGNHDTGSSTTGISIQSSGSGSPHENRPPYYALAYICRTW